MRIVAASPPPELLTLPWQLPLDQWEGPFLVALPRGLSRHIVRIVRVKREWFAVKETREKMAWREYRLLRDLRRMRVPAVEALGVVTGPRDAGTATRSNRRSSPTILVIHCPIASCSLAEFARTRCRSSSTRSSCC